METCYSISSYSFIHSCEGMNHHKGEEWEVVEWNHPFIPTYNVTHRRGGGGVLAVWHDCLFRRGCGEVKDCHA